MPGASAPWWQFSIMTGRPEALSLSAHSVMFWQMANPERKAAGHSSQTKRNKKGEHRPPRQSNGFADPPGAHAPAPAVEHAQWTARGVGKLTAVALDRVKAVGFDGVHVALHEPRHVPRRLARLAAVGAAALVVARVPPGAEACTRGRPKKNTIQTNG